MAPGRLTAGRASRWAAAGFDAPDAERDRAGHAAVVRALAAVRPDAVVYPATEWSLTACLEAGDGALTLPYARPAALAVLRDKRRMSELAAGAGFQVPITFHAGPAGAADLELIPTPCVVKPAAGAPGPVRIAGGRPELAAILAAASPGHDVLVQEYVEGELRAVAVVVGPGGELVGEFHQRALRIHPRQVGISAWAEGLAPDPAMTERVLALLRAAEFAGLAQVQYLSSPRGPVVLDVNPRFYGSIALALGSGVNLPGLWHASVSGTAPTAPPRYRAGLRYRWLLADVLDARTGQTGCLRGPGRPRVGPWWSIRDPLPGLVLAHEALTGRVRGRLQR